MKWAPPSGEQLWLQVKRNGDAMGMNPHFEGKSSVRVAVEARVARESHTPLDGTFLAWANPPDGAAAGGDYPFAFDCPDAATHDTLTLPVTVRAQIAAFAQQITVHESQEAYDAAQAAQGLSFESRSFIPSGLISPSGEPVTPPEPHALIAGQVIEAAERRERGHRPAVLVGAGRYRGRHVRRGDRSRAALEPGPAGQRDRRLVLAVGPASDERGAAGRMAAEAHRPRQVVSCRTPQWSSARAAAKMCSRP